ncbi:MAG TPA: hypothetical protein VF605_18395 [Allosphingosinicella sp.]|jgi:hypothetical protein
MLLGFGILGAAFVAGLWAVLVVNAGWNRAIASLTAFAVCPVAVLTYAYAMEDSLAGGMVLMFGMPVAMLTGLAGLGIAMLAEAVVKLGGSIDRDGDEN